MTPNLYGIEVSQNAEVHIMYKQNYSDYSIITIHQFHQIISWCCEFPYFSFKWKMEFKILLSIANLIKLGPFIG